MSRYINRKPIKSRTSLVSFISIYLYMILASTSVFAGEKGEIIAKDSYDRKESRDESSIGVMLLVDKSNRKKTRRFEMFSKEGADGRNLLIHFLDPADVKGTKFLNIGHRVGDDEQRLYLPALGKVRRISSANKNGSFVGSDLNYYDLEDREYEDYSAFKYLRDDTFNGIACYVIEQIPNDSNAPYSRQVVYVGKEDNFQYKIDSYDKRNPDRLQKTISVVEVAVIDGVTSFTKMIALDKFTGHKTLFELTDLKINQGLDDNVFSVRELKN